MSSFIVSKLERKKTKHSNPFINFGTLGTTRYMTKFSDEQMRNQMIELYGYNHINLKTMLNSTERDENKTKLERLLSIENVYPVVELKKIKIDDGVEQNNSSLMTTSHELYFQNMLKKAEESESLKKKNISCTPQDDSVLNHLLNLSKRTKELKVMKYQPVYEEESNRSSVKIEIEEDKSIVIIDDIFEGGEGGGIVKNFTFLRTSYMEPTNGRYVIPITGFFVLNDTEAANRKYKKIDLQEYDGENQEQYFKKFNTYYAIPTDMTIDDATDKILPTKSFSSYEEVLNASSVDLNDYKRNKENCSKNVISRNYCSNEKSKAERIKALGIIQEIDKSEDFKRVDYPIPDELNLGAPSLPDEFFLTNQNFTDKILNKTKTEFNKWESQMQKGCDAKNKKETNRRLLTVNNTIMKKFFERVHRVKYNTELKKLGTIKDHSSVINKDYAKEDLGRTFTNTTNEQKKKIQMAIDQFEHNDYKREDHFSYPIIKRLINEIGIQAFSGNHADALYNTFDQISRTIDKSRQIDDDKKKDNVRYIFAGLLIIYAFIDDKRFIVNDQTLKQFYKYDNLKLWNNEDKYGEPSSLLYVAKVLHVMEQNDGQNNESEEKVYDELKKMIQRYLLIINEQNLKNRVKEKLDSYKIKTSRDEINDLMLYEVNTINTKRSSQGFNELISLQVRKSETNSLFKKIKNDNLKYMSTTFVDDENVAEAYDQVLKENRIEPIPNISSTLLKKSIADVIQKKLKKKLNNDVNSKKFYETIDALLSESNNDVKFIEMNLHKDYYKQNEKSKNNKGQKEKELDFVKKIKKYTFKSETFLSMKISSSEKKYIKLYCILLQLSNLLDETDEAEFKTSYIDYISERLEFV